MVRQGPFGGGGVYRGKSCDRGVATPWIATGGGVAWKRAECGLESPVSNTELSEFFWALIEFWGEKLTEFGAELSEFYLPKQYSQHSIPPVS